MNHEKATCHPDLRTVCRQCGHCADFDRSGPDAGPRRHTDHPAASPEAKGAEAPKSDNKTAKKKHKKKAKAKTDSTSKGGTAAGASSSAAPAPAPAPAAPAAGAGK